MFRKLILLLVSSLGCFSAAVFAVGLGEYELKSGLNQPLKADIKLLSSGDLGEHEVHASLASAAVFERVGVERPYFLSQIRFETIRVNGELVVKLTTREPIKEPFLNFLVELNSPKERVIREYTFLLDPPIFEESTSSTIEKTQVTSQPSQTYSPPEPRQSPASQPSEATYTGSTYGPVSASDTLWSIATSVRPSNATVHQTLVAIYRANPDAFSNGNINNLLRGKVLQIPDANTISQVPHRAALQDVVMQNREWQSGGARRIVDNNQVSSSGQMTGDARLTLATPGSDEVTGNTASAGIQNRLEQTQNQLVRSQETSATLQAENDELRARLADALKKLETVQDSGGLQIADTELAVLSQSQDEQTDETSDFAATTDESSADDSLSDISDQGLTDASDSTDELSTDSSLTETDSLADTGSEIQSDSDLTNTSDATEQSSVSTTPANATPQVYIPPKPKGFFEELLDSSAVIWGAGAAILLIVVAVFWRMRKRMEEEDFQDDLVATAGAGTIDSTESFELPDVGDDMLVELDMDEGQEGSESDEENFDPLGEADIYIAYGKYEQAESLLLEAIDENPIRSDLKVKLMECYAENDDREKFESLAQEVSQAVDAEEWQEQISSLREQAWSGDSEGDDKGEDEFDLPSTEDIFGEDEFGLDDDSTTEVAEADLGLDDEMDLGDDDDFNLDSEDSAEEEFDIDMDLGLDEDEIEDRPSSEAVTETFDSIDEENFSLDDEEDEIDLDLDDEEESIDLDDSDDIALDLDEEEFDFDEEDSEFDSEEVDDGSDEIATKLDLARAYIDMGDADGAKEILSEVIAEGTDEQKEEAQALIQKAD